MEHSQRPLAIDLFTGLHGWSEGLVAEGFEVIGFDIEDMCKQFGQPRPKHVHLVIQDVLTLHGSQFKDAALIVASPPCQEFSYMAMPWSLAKEKRRKLLEGEDDPKRLTALFDACFRIQREAIEAAGHFIPLVVENVRGAIPWVGRSRWNYGSFHLWGDVPALMPMTKSGIKAPGMNWINRELRGQDFTRIASKHCATKICDCGHTEDDHDIGSDAPCCECSCINPRYINEGQKTIGHANIRDGYAHTRHLTNQAESDGVKQAGISGIRANGKGDRWFQDGAAQSGSKSKARKAASAAIAKIPLPLSRYIAAVFKPRRIETTETT